MNIATQATATGPTLDELKQGAADNAAQADDLLGSAQSLLADLRGEPRAASPVGIENALAGIVGQTYQLQSKTHSTLCEIDDALNALRRELFSSSLDAARAA